jgi:diguanylate cyclase (GGDEF)-like protein
MLHASLLSLRDFAYAASQGDLSKQVNLRGYVGGALKALQANLKHLSWQTKMVASGDFSQRVDFMGEFSRSFNAMVMQLDLTVKELLCKEAELRAANEEMLTEIAIRKQAEEAFRRLAITDALTGLYNRGHFMQLADTEVKRVLRYHRPLSVILLDIDFFKRINDTHGHASGDMVLKAIAQVIGEELRAVDVTARYGGEEFIVLLPETPANGAVIVAEKLRGRIEAETIQGEKCPLSVTASFGVNAHVGETDATWSSKIVQAFIGKADEALYASKRAGRNRVTVYEPEDEAPISRPETPR